MDKNQDYRIKPHPDLPKHFRPECCNSFMLEIQKFEMKRFQHIGYMNALFNFRNEAADYYNKYNPLMRKLNAHKTWKSDWDPNTKLRYIVRKHDREVMAIDPFNKEDLPIISTLNNCKEINYPTILPRTAYPKDLTLLEYIVQIPKVDMDHRKSIVIFIGSNIKEKKIRERVAAACGEGIKTEDGVYFNAIRAEPSIFFGKNTKDANPIRQLRANFCECYPYYLKDNYFNDSWFDVERHNPNHNFSKFKAALKNKELLIFDDENRDNEKIPDEDMELLRNILHKSFSTIFADVWSSVVILC